MDWRRRSQRANVRSVLPTATRGGVTLRMLISATLSPEAFEIRSRWMNGQKSAQLSEAIIFYDAHGPHNLKGLWRDVLDREKSIRHLQRVITAMEKGEKIPNIEKL